MRSNDPLPLPPGRPGIDREFTLGDFDFQLPPELIAQYPAARRSASRLLDGRSMRTQIPPQDRTFADLPGLLEPGDLLVFNDTQVIKARLLGEKASGGAVEALVERVLPANDAAPAVHSVWCHLRASKSPRAGSRLSFSGPDGSRFEAEVLGRCGPQDSLFHLQFPADPLALLQRFGHVPLPPYITREDSADDERRYQTVFSARPGAVAAPTASLHFDEAVLTALDARGVRRAAVTLHVGAGTFQPVRSPTLSEHRMHSEWFEVGPATVHAIEATRAAGGRIVAAGTTTLRALESAARSPDEVRTGHAEPTSAALAKAAPLQAGARETDIFITPGFGFRVVDVLITNFHLPRSTLMMLVSAFAGHAHIMDLYRHAIEARYRFFSYGDAMLLSRSHHQSALP